MNVEALDPQNLIASYDFDPQIRVKFGMFEPKWPISNDQFDILWTCGYISNELIIRIISYYDIYHIYLYQYFLKVKPPRKSFFVFHPCCHGASFQFLFLCGAVGDSEAFAVCDEFAHEFVYPKSQDHGRNT